jgi:hypothetical protein
MSNTSHSATNTGSFLVTDLISAKDSLMRFIGRSDFQPKASRLNRVENAYLYLAAVGMISDSLHPLRLYRW